MYRAVILRDVFVKDSLDLLEQIFALDDPYTQYVESLSSGAMGLTPFIDAARAVSDQVLDYEYFGKLEKRSTHLAYLAEHMEENLYDRVLKGQGIQKNSGDEYPIYKFTPYLKLQILCKVQGTPQKGDETLIAIDEAQNLAVEEYRLISAINHNNVVFNLYGDVKQHVEGTKGLDSWQDIKDIADFSIQQMNENYRNALQITEFCNERFHLHMKAINLVGDGVHQIKDSEDFSDRLNQLFHNPLKPGNSSIIVKTEEEAKYLIQQAGALTDRINDIASDPSDLMPNKWNLLTIDQAKGLEFETVIVLSGRMTENEKYIAYTRALNELYIYDQEVEIPDTTEKSEPETKSSSNKKKSDRPKREKWKKGDQPNKPKDDKKDDTADSGSAATPKAPQEDEPVEQSTPNLSLKEFFEEKGLKTVDMRNKSGALWVVGSKEQIGKIVDTAVEKYNISGAYATGKAIGYVEGWFTKSKK